MKLSGVNLNYLHHFHSIAELGSLKVAAERLHLSPSALTHSLKSLELLLGCSLCTRGKAGFSLTAEGLELFENIHPFLSSLASIELGSVKEGAFKGILSIGVIDHFVQETFENALNAVVRSFPLCKLSLQSMGEDRMRQAMLSREIEVGFGVSFDRDSRFKYFKIAEETMHLYISHRHPWWRKRTFTDDELNQARHVAIDTSEASRDRLERDIFSQRTRKKFRYNGFANNFTSMHQILMSGHSIVPLPTWYVDRFVDRSQIRVFEEIPYEKKNVIEAAVLKSAELSPAAQKLIEPWMSD